MRHQDGFFRDRAGAAIYYQQWLPDHDPKAVLLIVHGLAEHSGRYTNIIHRLIPLNYAVCGLDHIGHGRSEGVRVYVERFGDYTDTLKTYLDRVRQEYPARPIWMFAHSLGGLIGTYFLLDHQHELDGAIISAPVVKLPASISPWTITLAKLLSKWMPRAGLTPVEPRLVSRDPAVVQAYIDDPLVYKGKSTARLGAELIQAIQRVQAQAATITLPVLLIQGSADGLVDPTGAPWLYDQISSQDKSIKIYDGLYHETFNEPEREQVLDDIQAWLQTQLANRSNLESAR